MGFLALLSSPLGKIGLYAVVALAIVSAAMFMGHQHDARILAEQAAREAAAVAAQQVADMRRAVDAANAEAQAATARADALANGKKEIARAPVTVACAASPSIRAALGSLPGASGSGGGAAGGSGGAAGMPAAAGAPGRSPR